MAPKVNRASRGVADVGGSAMGRQRLLKEYKLMQADLAKQGDQLQVGGASASSSSRSSSSKKKSSAAAPPCLWTRMASMLILHRTTSLSGTTCLNRRSHPLLRLLRSSLLKMEMNLTRSEIIIFKS
eukprot:GSA25T00022246001.1